jgi:hypothetical protein
VVKHRKPLSTSHAKISGKAQVLPVVLWIHKQCVSMNTTAIVGTTQKVHYQVPAHLPSKISEKAEVLPVVSQACCSFVLLSAGRESMLTATGLHLQVVNCTAPAHLPSKDLREGPSAACGQLVV